jgi:hypothetical protein
MRLTLATTQFHTGTRTCSVCPVTGHLRLANRVALQMTCAAAPAPAAATAAVKAQQCVLCFVGTGASAAQLHAPLDIGWRAAAAHPNLLPAGTQQRVPIQGAWWQHLLSIHRTVQ